MVLSLVSVSFAANLKELDTVGNMAVESALSINKDGSTDKEIKSPDKLVDGMITGTDESGQMAGLDTFTRGDFCINTAEGKYIKIVLTMTKPVDFSGIRIYSRKTDDQPNYVKSNAAEKITMEFYDAAKNSVTTAQLTGEPVAPGGNIVGTQYVDFTVSSGKTNYTVSGAKKIVINIYQTFNTEEHWGSEEIRLTTGAPGAQKKTVAELKKLGFKAPEEGSGTGNAGNTGNTGNTGSTATGATPRGAGEINTVGNMAVESAKSLNKDGSEGDKSVQNPDKLTDGLISTMEEAGQMEGRDTFSRADFCLDTAEGKYIKIVLAVNKPVEFTGIRIYSRKEDATSKYVECNNAQKATLEFYDASGNSVKTAELESAAGKPGGNIVGTQYVDFTVMSGNKIYSVKDAKKIVINILQTYGTQKHWGAEEICLTNGKKGETKTVAELKKLGFKAPDAPVEVKDDKKKDNTSDEKYLDKTGWSITASAEEKSAKAPLAIDNNPNTFWHSYYEVTDGKISGKADPPFDLDVTLPKKTVVSGLSILPRSDSNSSGVPTKVQYFLMIDGEYKDLGVFDYPLGKTRKIERFKSNIEISGLRVRIIEGNAGYGTLAEIDLIPENKEYKTLTYDAFIENEKANKLYKIDKSGVTAKFDGDFWNQNIIDRTVDGSDGTFFQAGTAKNNYTFVIDVDLGDNYNIAAVSYFPRQDDKDGFWLNYKILTSTDGKNFTEAASEEKKEVDYSRHYTQFNAPVTARFFRFEISKGYGNLVSCAELDFYENYEDYKKRAEAEKEEYKLVIGKNEITHKGGTATLDTAPYIENGTTFIPLRGLLELMNATVEWNGENQSIKVNKGSTVINLQIRNYLVDVTTVKYGTVRYTLLAAPRITDSRTFIPIRFVSEQLGYNVEWDGATQTVTITK